MGIVEEGVVPRSVDAGVAELKDDTVDSVEVWAVPLSVDVGIAEIKDDTVDAVEGCAVPLSVEVSVAELVTALVIVMRSGSGFSQLASIVW